MNISGYGPHPGLYSSWSIAAGPSAKQPAASSSWFRKSSVKPETELPVRAFTANRRGAHFQRPVRGPANHDDESPAEPRTVRGRHGWLFRFFKLFAFGLHGHSESDMPLDNNLITWFVHHDAAEAAGRPGLPRHAPESRGQGQPSLGGF